MPFPCLPRTSFVMRLLLLVVAFALVGSGCSFFYGDHDDIACTLEFRFYTVRIVDTEGQPVNGLTTTITNTRTGDALDVADDAQAMDDGIYTVITDGQVSALSEQGDPIAFHAEGQGLTADAAFVFAGGPCHVAKLSGPEEIVATPTTP